MRSDGSNRKSDRTNGHRPRPISIAHIGTYPPRECGIATFTEDLAVAIHQQAAVRCSAVAALERASEPCTYAREVRWTIRDHDPDDYARAATELNHAGVDAVALQFEYGIFGGDDGEHLLRMLDTLTVPVVTTLHTVLPNPSPHQREVLQAVARRSHQIVVMNSIAVGLLERVYRIPPEQVVVIPHGAPDIPNHGHEQAQARLGLSGTRVLSTFGLLGRSKGIEFAIQAMTTISREFPDAVYYILGKTHPGVVRSEGGDRYRGELQTMVRDLGLERNVRFVNQYFDKLQLIQWLMATNVYVTPYLNPEQIVSGTLAYAMVAGKAIVSTPYLHARELLKHGRGILVPFRDASAVASAASELLRDRKLRGQLEQRAWHCGRTMTWRAVAERYVQLFHDVAAGATAESAATVTFAAAGSGRPEPALTDRQVA